MFLPCLGACEPSWGKKIDNLPPNADALDAYMLWIWLCSKSFLALLYHRFYNLPRKVIRCKVIMHLLIRIIKFDIFLMMPPIVEGCLNWIFFIFLRKNYLLKDRIFYAIFSMLKKNWPQYFLLFSYEDVLSHSHKRHFYSARLDV